MGDHRRAPVGRVCRKAREPWRGPARPSKGLPEPSWRFTLQAPSYLAVMTYLDDEGMRRQVYEAFVHRATEEKHDNRPIMRSILELRRREGPPAGLSRLRRSGAGGPDGARRRSRPAVPGGFKAQNGSVLSRKKTPICWPSPEKPSCSLGISLITRKSSAPRSMISTRRLCGPTFRWRALFKGCLRSSIGCTESRWWKSPACRCWDPHVKYYEIHDDSRPRAAIWWALFTPTGFRARTNAGAPGWITLITGEAHGDGRTVKIRIWA